VAALHAHMLYSLPKYILTHFLSISLAIMQSKGKTSKGLTDEFIILCFLIMTFSHTKKIICPPKPTHFLDRPIFLESLEHWFYSIDA
jgi:hypothetical protein